MIRKLIFTLGALVALIPVAPAQKYRFVDKTVAVVGSEAILVSDLENEVKNQAVRGYASDKNVRCELLESILESKLFLAQARVDSLNVDQDAVESELSQHVDEMMFYLGGQEKLEEYFGKPLHRLRQEWRSQYEKDRKSVV